MFFHLKYRCEKWRKIMDTIIEELAAKEAETLSLEINMVQVTFAEMKFGEEDDFEIYPSFC